MASNNGAYIAATRHPWACVLFVLPLLLAYEAGAHLLATGHPEALRNGADLWLRRGLAQFGLAHWFWPPLLLLLVLGVWCWARRHDRPQELTGVWTGMAVESAIFALALWGMCHGLAPLLEEIAMQISVPEQSEPAMEQIICFLGAGIYEETLFRLLLFSTLTRLLRQTDFPPLAALSLAGLLSGVLFAGAHNVGPHGEAFDLYVFLFRSFAGLYFAVLYHLRGFGIAVGSHAGYDVLVGILLDL